MNLSFFPPEGSETSLLEEDEESVPPTEQELYEAQRNRRQSQAIAEELHKMKADRRHTLGRFVITLSQFHKLIHSHRYQTAMK